MIALDIQDCWRWPRLPRLSSKPPVAQSDDNMSPLRKFLSTLSRKTASSSQITQQIALPHAYRVVRPFSHASPRFSKDVAYGSGGGQSWRRRNIGGSEEIVPCAFHMAKVSKLDAVESVVRGSRFLVLRQDATVAIRRRYLKPLMMKAKQRCGSSREAQTCWSRGWWRKLPLALQLGQMLGRRSRPRGARC